MELREKIESTDLDMTEAQVKAFFLGILCAEKPMPFAKGLEELLAEVPDAKRTLEAPLKVLWDELRTNLKFELDHMFPEEDNIVTFMEISKDQLDFFLTAMSLSGTSTDSCDDEELAELIDELEDTIEDMEEYLEDKDATKEDGENFKEFLLATWADFTSTKQ